MRRAVIDPVEHGLGRGLVFVAEIIDSCHVGAVYLITNSEQDERSDEQYCEHFVHLQVENEKNTGWNS